MPNFFYADANGQKQGPVNDQQLKALAAQGVITPQTPMETDSGYKGTAGQLPGLFAAVSAPFVQAAPATPSAGTIFCTNCGNSVFENAVACMSCGAAPIGHRKFCRQCGVALNPEQIVCVKCGSGIGTAVASRSVGGAVATGMPRSSSKDRMTAGLLAIFVPFAYKFYLGDEDAVTRLLLCFVLIGSILSIIDGIKLLQMSDAEFAAKYP